MTLSIVLLHLVCQDSGERSDFLQDLIQFGIGVVCRVPLAQLAQVNVEVVAARNGEGTLYSHVQCVPRLLARRLGLLTCRFGVLPSRLGFLPRGLNLLPHSIHAFDELRRNLPWLIGGLHAEIIQHEPRCEAEVVRARYMALEHLLHLQ